MAQNDKKSEIMDLSLLQDDLTFMRIMKWLTSGIDVVERVPHAFPSNDHNEFYLSVKKEKSGHLL